MAQGTTACAPLPPDPNPQSPLPNLRPPAPRIGIMARGRLRCIGSSLRLKARFGSGYRVSVRVQVGDYCLFFRHRHP